MERIKLNLIPSGVAPIVHLSQYDDGRKFGIDLFEGESVYVLDGTETLTVNSRKPDGHVVVLAVTNTGTSSLDVDTVEQLTAVHGVSYAKLKIEKGSVTIATLPFLIDVSRDPLENGDPSESFIQNLETQVSEMVAEDVAEQYDSANVIFDNEPTENHGIGYTVTSEGIKTAIDNAFDYDNTASGSLVHITDGADNIPVKSLVSEIVAVESGNGQPKSPSNPYTISGFDSGVVSVCGVNLWNEQWEIGSMSETGEDVEGNGFRSKTHIPILENTSYYLHKTSNYGNNIYVYFYDENKTYINKVHFGGSSAFTTANGTKFIRFYIWGGGITYNTYYNDISINYPSTDTQYHAYNGNTYTFNFGQTAYGGHFDNKGNLVVTKIAHIFDGSESFISLESGTVFAYDFGANMLVNSQVAQGKSLSTHFIEVDSGFGWNSVTSGKFLVAGNRYFGCNPNMSLADYKTFLTNQYQANTPVKAICLLANPITLSITSQDIPTLLGENNIYSITGDLEANYYTSKSNDILEFINSEIGKKNGDNIPIEANSQDSIKTYVDNEISSTKDYIDNGLNDKVAYKSGEVVYSNYIAGAYVSGSGNYVEFCIPINTKASSGTITNLGTTLNVFIGNTRLTNEVTLSDSSVVAIKDGYAQIELKLNSTQTANSVATVSLDGFTVNFA